MTKEKEFILIYEVYLKNIKRILNKFKSFYYDNTVILNNLYSYNNDISIDFGLISPFFLKNSFKEFEFFDNDILKKDEVLFNIRNFLVIDFDDYNNNYITLLLPHTLKNLLSKEIDYIEHRISSLLFYEVTLDNKDIIFSLYCEYTKFLLYTLYKKEYIINNQYIMINFINKHFEYYIPIQYYTNKFKIRHYSHLKDYYEKDNRYISLVYDIFINNIKNLITKYESFFISFKENNSIKDLFMDDERFNVNEYYKNALENFEENEIKSLSNSIKENGVFIPFFYYYKNNEIYLTDGIHRKIAIINDNTCINYKFLFINNLPYNNDYIYISIPLYLYLRHKCRFSNINDKLSFETYKDIEIVTLYSNDKDEIKLFFDVIFREANYLIENKYYKNNYFNNNFLYNKGE